MFYECKLLTVSTIPEASWELHRSVLQQ